MSEKWRILYYETQPDKSPIEVFIDDLRNKKAQAKIIRSFELLEKFGLAVGLPHIRKVGANLWELRVIFAGNQYRFLFFPAAERQFVIVHAFQKKTRKLPRRDVELAIKRMKAYLGD